MSDSSETLLNEVINELRLIKNFSDFFNVGREFSPTQQYVGIMLMAVPLLWLFGAGAAFSWVVGEYLVFLHMYAYLLT